MIFKKLKNSPIFSLLPSAFCRSLSRVFPSKSLVFGLWSLVFGLFLTSCGYSTRGFFYAEKEIFITPVKNSIDITSQERKNAEWTTYPILLEKQLTNSLVDRFNTDGYLKVVNNEQGSLKLSCTVTRYEKEALRHTDTDNVEEQRLRLFVDMVLNDSKGDVLKTKTVIGETSYYLSGSRQKTEASARQDLIEDTARRITEVVIEEW